MDATPPATPTVPSPARREVARVTELTVRFGEVTALDNVSLAIEGPQVVGVLGPNGAGKTTLVEVLEGLRTPSAGAVSLFGRALRGLRAYPRRRIGAVLQREFVLDGITAGEYAELFAAIYALPRARARAVLAQAELLARARVPVERLSGGEAQRLFIAAAVAHEPELLFLDEPTAHLDPETRARIGALVRDMGRTRTVLLTTHDLAEADAVCDALLFLVAGRVRAFGPREALLAAVPPAARRGGAGAPATLHDAFFHFCGSRLGASGELIAEASP